MVAILGADVLSQKEAEIEWNAATQYTYTGNACGIEANVKADSL